MHTVLIVDDHAVVSHGLKTALELHGYEVVAVATTIMQARALLAHRNPDTVLLDLNLPDGSGFELLLWIRKISQSIGVVILSFNNEQEYVHAARKGGANAYIVKSAPMKEIIAAVGFSLASPRSFTGPHIALQKGGFDLTTRELDILRLVAIGKTNNEMGEQLFLSLSTIKSHVSSILRKLEVSNRVSAIKVARENGLLIE